MNDALLLASLLDTATQIGETFQVALPKFLGQVLHFLIVAAVLYFFAVKPLLKTVDQRQKQIADGLQYAEETKVKLAEAEKKYAEALQKGAQEAQRLIEEARLSARDFLEAQKKEATAKAESLLENARKTAAFEKEKMMAEVRGEIVELVLATTGKVLAKDLTGEQRAAFSESAARELLTRN